MLRRFSAVLFIFSTALAQAAEAPARQLAAELLAQTGTAAVFDSPQVQAALADPEPFLGPAAAPRRDRLLDEAGFRQWRPPRVWLLQSRREGDVEHWENIASLHEVEAGVRGYRLLNDPPLPAAEQAVSLLVPGQPHPGLPELLKAYGADALVLVRGQDWGLWAPGVALQGTVPAAGDLLPDVLAEALAALQQWPEAVGRVVVQVNGIRNLADFAQVQSALQALPGARQVQLVRLDRLRAWFALSAPGLGPLTVALEGEPRLPAAVKPMRPGLLPRAVEAQRLASPLLVRQWTPDAAPKPSAPAGAPLQSPPL